MKRRGRYDNSKLVYSYASNLRLSVQHLMFHMYHSSHQTPINTIYQPGCQLQQPSKSISEMVMCPLSTFIVTNLWHRFMRCCTPCDVVCLLYFTLDKLNTTSTERSPTTFVFVLTASHLSILLSQTRRYLANEIESKQ